jgi:hypothetical protein
VNAGVVRAAMSVARQRRGMNTDELFLRSDAALRDVIDRIGPADLTRSAPAEWTSTANPTFRDILQAHTYDEAWVPDVLRGRAAADGDDLRGVDLLGDDPIGAYDARNDAATAAVRAGGYADTFRFSYGDYPAAEGLAHLATYRAFQAWQIAKHLGILFHLSPELIAGLEEHVVAFADEWRQWGVFLRHHATCGCRRRDASALCRRLLVALGGDRGVPRAGGPRRIGWSACP